MKPAQVNVTTRGRSDAAPVLDTSREVDFYNQRSALPLSSKSPLLGGAAPPPPRTCCTIRALLLLSCSLGIMTQTALRSVPNLVMNGENGMANDFNWLNAERGMVLGAFGWGYTATQLPGGVISQILGPRLTMFWFVLIGSLAGLLVPQGAQLTFAVPLSLNFIIGMAQGPVFPVLNGLLAQWLRPSEMARGNALMKAAWNFGQVVQYVLSPVLLRIGGWHWAWYFYAGCGLVWSWLWLRAAADTPETHPRISQAEIDWIRDKEKPLADGSQGDAGKSSEAESDDFDCRVFRRIISQKPVVVVSLCAALDGLGGAFANWLPQYYNTQLNFDLQSSGVMVALPLVVAMFSMILGGHAADRVLGAGVPLSRVRRWFNFIPTLGMAFCTLLLVKVRHPTTGKPSPDLSIAGMFYRSAHYHCHLICCSVVLIMAVQNFFFGESK